MKYKDNRLEYINKYKIITSIDRFKLTYQFLNDNNILNENFKLLNRVKKGRVTEIGLYALYESTNDTEPLLDFIRGFTKDSSGYYKKMKIRELGDPEKVIIDNGIKYIFKEFIEINHHEYLIIGYNKSIRLAKIKSYLTMEINDIIQDNPDQKLSSLCRNTIEHLIRSNIFVFNSTDKNDIAIENKANELLNDFNNSEIELAIDIDYKYSIKFYSRLLKSDSEKLKVFKNTIYYNNSMKSHRKDWFWKFYNKSLKDRYDNGINSERFFKNDVYRFEITLQRDTLINLLSIKDLELHQVDIIEKVKPYTRNAIRAFSNIFGYEFIKTFLIDHGVTKITKRNYITKLQDLFFKNLLPNLTEIVEV